MQLINANIYMIETFNGNRAVLVAEIGNKTFSEQIECGKDTNLAEEVYNRLSWMLNDKFFLLSLLQDRIASNEVTPIVAKPHQK